MNLAWVDKVIHRGPYSQRDFKSILTKHDFNDFLSGVKIDT